MDSRFQSSPDYSEGFRGAVHCGLRTTRQRRWEDGQVAQSKLQTPNIKLHRSSKSQAPNTKGIPSSKLQTVARASSLEMGAWSFSGVWSLVFGVFDSGISLEFGVLGVGVRR